MTRLPRDLSGDALVKALQRQGYDITRQTGSHVRLTSTTVGQQHHVSVPRHRTLKVGTLYSIIAGVAEHQKLSPDELLDRLFG